MNNPKNFVLVIFLFVVGIGSFLASCTNTTIKEKTKDYGYIASSKSCSKNNRYSIKNGFPSPKSGDWDKRVRDNSIILVNQDKGIVTFFLRDINKKETYHIINSSTSKILSGNSFNINVKNEHGGICTISFYDDLVNPVQVSVFRPMKPICVYSVEYFDVSKLMNEIKGRFDRIPSN